MSECNLKSCDNKLERSHIRAGEIISKEIAFTANKNICYHSVVRQIENSCPFLALSLMFGALRLEWTNGR